MSPKDCWVHERKFRRFAYQFNKTFLGFTGSVRVRSGTVVGQTHYLQSSLQIGFGLCRRSNFAFRGLVVVGLGCSTLVFASGSMWWSVTVPSHDISAWEKTFGEHFVWFLERYMFQQLLLQIVVWFCVDRVLPHYCNRYQRLTSHIHIPCFGIPIIVFNVDFQIRIPLAWRCLYIWYELTRCEVVQPHSKKHLGLIGANFVYQIIVFR